jgi:AcrR family transcriptional regulator
MPPAAKSKPKTRRYHSPHRQEQAEATRMQILDAAERLFLRDGYAATSMSAIAKEAGVASKTVYLAFETKPGLLRELWHRSLRGGAGDVPVANQEWFRAVLDEPDPERALRLNARNSRRVKSRIAPLGEVLRSAAAAEPASAALLKRIWSDFYENQREVVKALHKRKALKRGLGVDRAADILWTLNHPDLYVLLLNDRGWSEDMYERWLGDISSEQLLRKSGASGS